MKYVLIEVVDRDISKPEFFDSFEAVHYRMCQLVAEAAGATVDEIIDANNCDGEFDADTYIGERSAWAGRHSSYDWFIFDVDEDEILCKSQMETEGDDKK